MIITEHRLSALSNTLEAQILDMKKKEKQGKLKRYTVIEGVLLVLLILAMALFLLF